MNTILPDKSRQLGFGWVALALVLALGCGCSLDDASMTNSTPGEDIPILWQKSGTYSRIMQPARILAIDAATLAQVPITEIPVDFENQMVLIAALGPTTGDDVAIRISRIWREGSQLRVEEQRSYPSLEQSVALEPASPWTAVVIPRTELNVEGYSAKIPPNLLGEHLGAR